MICATCKKELFACDCLDADEKILSIMSNPRTELLGRQVRRERIIYRLGIANGRELGKKEMAETVEKIGGKHA